MGAASAAADAGPESLVAGGNLGAAISYGDITAGGVGTVTSVCDDRLVGFGHPMTYGGETTLGLMPADAIYVQEDPVGPGFKVANMGAPAGTIDQDRLTGISGSLGVLPPETDVTSTVTYGARNRTGSTASLVQDFNADITFTQILANHDRVIDAIQPGSETATYSVSGTDAGGNAFDIDFGDRYTSQYDIAFEGIFDIADLVWVLSRMRGRHGRRDHRHRRRRRRHVDVPTARGRAEAGRRMGEDRSPSAGRGQPGRGDQAAGHVGQGRRDARRPARRRRAAGDPPSRLPRGPRWRLELGQRCLRRQDPGPGGRGRREHGPQRRGRREPVLLPSRCGRAQPGGVRSPGPRGPGPAPSPR